MEPILIFMLALSSLAWAVLILGRGGFWRADIRLGAAPDPDVWPAVAVVIPARNEAAQIGEVVAAHRSSTYPGAHTLVVADDHSDDATAVLARRAGGEIAAVPPLPTGWTGKLWALEAGIAAALKLQPEARWILLTDGDIRHAPDTLARLIAWGEARDLGVVSLMARLDARGISGRLLIPAFVFFFQKLYPFSWVNDPAAQTAAAAGGCLLIRRDALAAIGGIGAIRGALIDDCTLAARVKGGGWAVWLGLARDETVSLRDNRSLGSIWRMVRRTAFAQLRHSGWLLAGSLGAMTLVYLIPLAGVVWGGWPAVLGGTLWCLMACAYWPVLRHYGISRIWAPGLPLAALLYMAMTCASAVAHWRGHGGAWKGRVYPG